MTSFISFAHRLNRDSSVDSICTRCYKTVANEKNESILLSAESAHRCDPDGEITGEAFYGSASTA
jgi:hypothetical protein